MAQSSTGTADLRRKLDAFLVDNDELEALTARLSTFNLFRVLRVENAEIRHSNLLAWLLTPGESHGLGANFLRRFLSRLLMENDFLETTITPAQVELMKFDDVEVQREWQNIDIVAHSRSQKWCLLIENKIGSRESAGQLVRYREIVERDFNGMIVLPVYLTVEGDDPSEEAQKAGYVPLGHGQILELAERLTTQHRSRIPGDAAVLLDHYLDTLRRLTMQDEELVGLCRTIYRKHREAIDLVVQYGAASQVLEACESRVAALVDVAFVHSDSNRVYFVPTEMAECQRDVLSGGWNFLPRKVPVVWWFLYRKKVGKLQLSMEVGPFADPAVRIALLEALRADGFSFGDGALREEAKWTRILSKQAKLRLTEDGDVDDDPAYIETVAESLWEKGWGEGKRVLKVLRDFAW